MSGALQSRQASRSASTRLASAMRWELALLVPVVVALVGRTQTWLIVAGALALVIVAVGIPWTGRSLIGSVVNRLRFRQRRARRVEHPDLPIDLVPLAQWLPGLQVNQTRSASGAEVGVVTDGESWTAILSLTSDDLLMADAGEKIDLEALSGLTRQDDIVFAGLQLVTYTVPAPVTALLRPGSVAAQAYLEIAETPPPAVRRTWLSVRLDPRLCLEAVARRGASNDGIHGTLRFGLHRVQAALKRQGLTTRVLTPMEIYEVLSFTTGSTPDHGSERSTESWTTWECDGLVHLGARVRGGGNASMAYQSLISALDRAPVLFAVTSYTIDDRNQSSGAVRLVAPNRELADRAHEHLRRSLPKQVTLSGRGGLQVPTVIGTVPLGRAVV
ncbi:type VII secretion protein EccE [Aestuariimicrobium soli]|uniref:type VII secretion protein EccE n=1 Tax=Aestuariimicrobium soli TaxID=2035834 RepID=UPI003EBE28D3